MYLVIIYTILHAFKAHLNLYNIITSTPTINPNLASSRTEIEGGRGKRKRGQGRLRSWEVEERRGERRGRGGEERREKRGEED